MKLILDANTTSHFTRMSDEARAIIDCLRSKGKLATGGKNLEELLKTKVRELVIEFLKAGRGEQVSREKLISIEANLDMSKLTSDDPHVIALALASGARVLFTDDQLLMDDFTNASLLSRPRGSIYRYADRHGHLLS